MIATKTGSNAGPIAGFIAHANPTQSPKHIRLLTYRKNLLAPAVLDNQPNADTTGGFGASLEFSNNADFLVAGSSITGVNSFKVYSRNGTAFTALTVPSWTSNDSANSVFITPSGEYISTVNKIYHNNSGSLTLLAGAAGNSNALSPDGLFLAKDDYRSSDDSYGVRIMKRSGSGNSASFSNHQFISFGQDFRAQPTALRFSRNGEYLAVGNAFAPRLRIYKYNSTTDTFVALNQPPSGGTQPSFTVYHIAWAFDDSLLSVSDEFGVSIYERSADAFTFRAFINTDRYGVGRTSGFHPSGNFLITYTGNIYRKITASNWQFMTSVNPNLYGSGSTFSPLITS